MMKSNYKHLTGLPLLGAALGTQCGAFLGQYSNEVLSYAGTGLSTGAFMGLVLGLYITYIHTPSWSQQLHRFNNWLAAINWQEKVKGDLVVTKELNKSGN